jgi:hypothetical protein
MQGISPYGVLPTVDSSPMTTCKWWCLVQVQQLYMLQEQTLTVVSGTLTVNEIINRILTFIRYSQPVLCVYTLHSPHHNMFRLHRAILR